MASAVNFTAVAVVFKNECTRDLSLRAKSPLFGQLLVLVLVLLVLVVLVLVLVNMLSNCLAKQRLPKAEQIPGSGLRRMLPKCRAPTSSMS